MVGLTLESEFDKLKKQLTINVKLFGADAKDLGTMRALSKGIKYALGHRFPNEQLTEFYLAEDSIEASRRLLQAQEELAELQERIKRLRSEVFKEEEF